MRIYDAQNPRHLANKIYSFSQVNEVWTIFLDASAEVWIQLKTRTSKDKPKRRKHFKMSIAEKYMTIWRIK